MSDQIIGDLEDLASQEFTPALSGMGMEKTITVYNPMPVDFRVKYTRSIAMGASVSPELAYTKEKTGLDLSKRGPTSGHVSHTIVLKANSSVNLPGDIAQIAVQKLISVIIQTRDDGGSWDFEGHGGNKGMVPDPFRRQQVEQEVILEIKDTMSLMNRETPLQFTERQLGELNSPIGDIEVEDGQPAPGTGLSYTPKKAVSPRSGQSNPEESGTTPEAPVTDRPKRGRPKAAALKT